MKPDWSSLLEAGGGAPAAHLGDPLAEARAALDGALLAHLGQLAVLELSGTDALDFLAGQVTSDLKALTPGHSQLGAWCSPQGRVRVVFRICRSGERLLLFLPAALAPAIERRLNLFVLRAQVRIRRLDGPWVCAGLAGAELPERLSGLLQLPAEPGAWNDGGDTAVLRVPEGRPRWLLAGAAERLRPLGQTLGGAVTQAGHQAWRLLDILGGVPVVTAETQDSFLPQMLNLQALGGLSYRKGCYPGQEVIARLHFRGQLKRRMVLARASGDEPAPPGTGILSPGQDEKAGQVLDAALHPDGGQALLAVINLALLEAPLHLGGPDGAALALQPLPYAVADG